MPNLMTGRKTSTAGTSRVFVRFHLAPKEQLFSVTWQFDRIFLAQSDLDITCVMCHRHISKVRQKNIKRVIVKKFERSV